MNNLNIAVAFNGVVERNIGHGLLTLIVVNHTIIKVSAVLLLFN